MTITVDTKQRVIHNGNLEIKYSADDFVNAENYDFHHSVWNGRNDAKAWVITNAGYVLAIVFAEYFSYCDQDALDEAADSGKLDGLQVSESELDVYWSGDDSEGNPEYEGVINLGNASEPFASESLDYFIVPAVMFADDEAIKKVIEENPAEV